jgi:hypothetical protein
VNRDAQLAALASRIKCYDDAALRSHDPTIITGFKDAARNLLEHRQKMVAEPLYELPPSIVRELGLL